MEFNATLKFFRVSPRKVRELADELRGKDINHALNYLTLSPRKRVAVTLSKLLKSAVANADQKGTVDVDRLFVKSLMVSAGPTLKRFVPRAKGSASGIKKRTSHIFVSLSEKR